MGIRGFKPTSPALRHMTVSTFEEITKKKPEKAHFMSVHAHILDIPRACIHREEIIITGVSS